MGEESYLSPLLTLGFLKSQGRFRAQADLQILGKCRESDGFRAWYHRSSHLKEGDFQPCYHLFHILLGTEFSICEPSSFKLHPTGGIALTSLGDLITKWLLQLRLRSYIFKLIEFHRFRTVITVIQKFCISFKFFLYQITENSGGFKAKGIYPFVQNQKQKAVSIQNLPVALWSQDLLHMYTNIQALG